MKLNSSNNYQIGIDLCAVGHEVHDGEGQLVNERIELWIAEVDHAGERQNQFEGILIMKLI